jgi:Mce-associated membrane protein
VSSEDRPAGAVATSEPDTPKLPHDHGGGGISARDHADLSRARPNRARSLVLPLALTVILALVGAALTVRTAQLRDDPVIANRALVDNGATTRVIGDVSNALAKVFSYSYADTAATQQAARDVLAGTAYRQYEALFAQVVQQAPAQELTVTTRVVRAGVIRMSGDTAQLLVFLDQVVTRGGEPSGTVAAAQLSITAQRRDGHWRITDIQAR